MTFYSLVIASGSTLSIMTAVGVGHLIPPGMVTGVGILAFHALALLATDALVSHYQAKKYVPDPSSGVTTPAPTVSIVPSMSVAQHRDGSTTPTFGAAGIF